MSRMCPLCFSTKTTLLYSTQDQTGYRNFERCYTCDLVFVPVEFHISEDDQLKRYQSHNNNSEDSAYRTFLSRMLDELRPYLVTNSRALDYGSGPGPALAQMLHDEGLRVSTYDPFFQPDKSVLRKQYEIVTCTETAEHFAKPRTDFDIIDSALLKGGYLGIMTSMLKTWDDFPNWYYHRDPTHISFYSLTTMSWVAEAYSWEVYFPRDHVVIFRKLV